VLALALLCARSTRARADNAVPVRDLPPFPDVTSEEEKLAGVTMAGATLAEEDVVVGASKREQSLGSVASAVTIVSAERLRRFGYRTLAEALESVVGLYIVDDRMVERLGIRGVQLLGDANTRILVLVDGSPVNEPWSQYVDTSSALPVNLDDVARVEVIRGPVSSIYGTNAFLGIINIVTLEADKAPRAYGRLGVASVAGVDGSAGFGYGSLDRQVRGTFSFERRGGEDLEYPEFGEATPPGPTGTSADGQLALNGSLTVQYDRLFFHVRGYDRTRELPGAPYNSLAGSTDNTDTDQQLLAEAGYTQPFGDRFTLATRVYADRYRFVGDLTLVDSEGSTARETPFTTTGKSTWFGAEVRGLTEVLPHGQLSLTTGVAAEWSLTDSRSVTTRDVMGTPTDQVVTVDKDLDSQGIYAEASSSPWPWLGLTAGVRYDNNSLFQDKLSPRGALFLKKGDRFGLKLLYAEGFRNPSVFEAFYADGARYKPSLDGDGNSVLFPENITSYEAVLWGRIVPGLNARVSAWQWDLARIIEKGSVYDPDALDERLQYQNIFRGLRSRGVEVETSYRDTRGWLGFANATFAQVRKDPDGNATEVVNSPELTANAGVSTPPIYGHAYLSTEVSYLSARHTREFVAHRNNFTDAEAFWRWNVVIYVPSVNGFDVTVGVRNLLGVREQIPAQSDYDRVSGVSTYLVPGEGRELFARVGYRY
jgi:outer membrane receptor for ferrienterochelin and colicins